MTYEPQSPGSLPKNLVRDWSYLIIFSQLPKQTPSMRFRIPIQHQLPSQVSLKSQYQNFLFHRSLKAIINTIKALANNLENFR